MKKIIASLIAAAAVSLAFAFGGVAHTSTQASVNRTFADSVNWTAPQSGGTIADSVNWTGPQSGCQTAADSVNWTGPQSGGTVADSVNWTRPESVNWT